MARLGCSLSQILELWAHWEPDNSRTIAAYLEHRGLPYEECHNWLSVVGRYSKEKVMGKSEIIDLALHLKAAERYEVAEQIMQSLDKPDAEIDRILAEEALRRAQACDEGRMRTLSFEEVFGGK
jgi:putative addiction module component (TIGR02574 family)